MLSSGLRNQLFQFIKSDISLSQLEEWYVPRLAYLLRSPTSDDAEVVASIALGLSELKSGIIDEEGFRSSMQEALREHKTIWVEDNLDVNTIITTSGTSNQERNVVLPEIFPPEQLFKGTLVAQ
jgi:hypothetical protein